VLVIYSPLIGGSTITSALAFSYPKYIGSADRTGSTCCWTTIFQCGLFRVLYLTLCSALYTVRFHTSLLV